MNCRHCSAPLFNTILDLGFAPPSNSYLTELDLKRPEKYFPLRIKLCNQCWLVQTEDYTDCEELFNSDYAYFSSTSTTWVDHAAKYSKKIISELNLNKISLVIEVASNDGYLLRNFVEHGIPCIGIEPTKSTAIVSEQIGIPVIQEFFGVQLARQLADEGRLADLIIGNNVYAHVPDINDFTAGLKLILKPGGTITLEFPHILCQIQDNQFDTFYHEHFSYLSLNVVNKIFNSLRLKIINVEKITTHGGSLRIYGCHENDSRISNSAVNEVLHQEVEFGLQKEATYKNIQASADKIKNDLIEFLINQKRLGRKVAAYGAAAKGNTLLNYAGIKKDLIECIYDAAQSKQGKYMPGSHIPIFHPSKVFQDMPDYLIVLPWNIASEIMNQNINLVKHGTKFIIAHPRLRSLN